MRREENRSRYAPQPRVRLSMEEFERNLATVLKEQFALDPLSSLSVVVEGLTDQAYIRRAAELQLEANGEDLLQVPEHLTESGERILICSPGTGNDPTRGGTPQIVRLARTLQPFVFTLEMFRGLVFVLDHDEAGQSAQREIQAFGFRPNVNSITLDPKIHTAACGKKQVVVEDLLSLRMQLAFFEGHRTYCSVDYVDGVATRFHWSHQSKRDLCQFVLTRGTLEDFAEIIQLLRRVRRVFGFPR